MSSQNNPPPPVPPTASDNSTDPFKGFNFKTSSVNEK
jgi:hypothetical protein